MDFDIHTAGQVKFIFEIGSDVTTVKKVVAEIAFELEFYAVAKRVFGTNADFVSGFGIAAAVGHVEFFDGGDVKLFDILSVEQLKAAFAAQGFVAGGVIVGGEFGLVAQTAERADVGFAVFPHFARVIAG